MLEFQSSDCSVDFTRLVTAMILFAVVLFPLSWFARRIRRIDGSGRNGANGDGGVGRRPDFVIIAAFLLAFAALMAADSWYSFWDLMNCREDGRTAESFRPDSPFFMMIGGIAGATVWFGLGGGASDDRKDETNAE